MSAAQFGKRLLFGWLLQGFAPVQAQHLYVFAVVADGTAHQPDAARLHQLADEVARYGNYTQHWYKLSDSTAFSAGALHQTLTDFRPQSAEEDIIWLHYAGQGYSDGPKAWPTLCLNGGDVPLRDILALLRTKPVRTLLLTIDCGNRPRPSPPVRNGSTVVQGLHTVPVRIRPHVTLPAQVDVPDMAVSDGYRQLFRAPKVRQIIIMASATYGQQSFVGSRNGSVWLAALTNAIAETIRAKPPDQSWKQIQGKMVRLVQQRTRNRQTPLYNRQTVTCCETETTY